MHTINRLLVSFILLLSVFNGFAGDKITQKDLLENLPEEKKLYFLAVATLSRPFLQDSPDVIKEKDSLYQFFSHSIYKKLKGNYFLGYIYDEGFSFSGNEVKIEIIKGTYKTKKYIKAFRKAGEISAKKHGFKLVEKSPYGIGIAVVGVQPVRDKSSFPGVMLEVYLTNRKTKKTFFYRFGTGSKEGLTQAMLDAWDIVFNILKNSREK